jgi:hypothetical protein
MSGEIRNLSVSIITVDWDRQKQRGIPEDQRLSHDEISGELAERLEGALRAWYQERGHLYLEIEPEGFGV